MPSYKNFIYKSLNDGLINSVVDMILQHPDLLDDLWAIALTDDPAAWKAVWVMDKIHDNHPDLILPYLKPMLENVEHLKQSGQKRHMLKLISLHPLSDEPTGGFIDYCFTLLQCKTEPVAGRVHAMQILFNIAKVIPEFKNELRIVIEDAMIEGSPGIISRGHKILQNL